MSRSVNTGAVDGRTLRWAGHRQQRRESLVSAALVLVEVAGPTVSVSSLAAATGVARAVIYRHFTDKADLKAAMAASAAASLLVAISPDLRIDGPLDDAVGRALVTYLRWLGEHPQLFRLLRHQAHSSPADNPLATVKTTVAQRLALLASHNPGADVENAGEDLLW